MIFTATFYLISSLLIDAKYGNKAIKYLIPSLVATKYIQEPWWKFILLRSRIIKRLLCSLKTGDFWNLTKSLVSPQEWFFIILSVFRQKRNPWECYYLLHICTLCGLYLTSSCFNVCFEQNTMVVDRRMPYYCILFVKVVSFADIPFKQM